MSKHIVPALLGLGALTCAANSPYISKVYEYQPAPGQFVNELPEFESGDTPETILAKAGEQLIGSKTPGMITLGAFGGYVVFGFDHPVVNAPGEYDFKVYGNAIISDRDNKGGSSEPGIVWVSEDVNGNGLPDDPWYELAGSEYTKASTLKGLELTYYRPAADKAADPDPEDKSVTDRTYIRWTSSDGTTGYVQRNVSHDQSYWPEWLADQAEISRTGTCVAPNYTDVAGDGSYYLLQFLDWGYADNLPNSEDPGFKLDWAVKSDGTPANLAKADFIKVQTGINQTCGRLGETSTEVSGAEDLHPDNTSASIAAPGTDDDAALVLLPSAPGTLQVRASADTPYALLSMNGALLSAGTLSAGHNTLDTAHLPAGIYLLRTPTRTLKFPR